MNKNNKTIIFSTLAFNQTLFYVKIAKKLIKNGFDVKFISFHQRSNKYITQNNYEVFDVFKYQKKTSEADYLRIEKKYNINLNRLISHEKYFYRESSSNKILKKVTNYFFTIERILDKIEKDFNGKITIVHELGGVSAIQVLFQISQYRKLDNLFLEPSFIKNRIFILKNMMNALQLNLATTDAIRDEVKEYLELTIKNKEIVVPEKDKWRHGSTFQIVANVRWYKRLVEKTFDKYIWGYKEEFNYILNWVTQHIRMIINRIRILPHYGKIQYKYIYFPLHVPADMALTVRAPELLDQYTLIDYLARSIPITHKLVIKEHPAFVGGTEYNRIVSLLKTHDNIILSRPINNFDVVNNCDLLITINSKAGVEAIVCGKPVIVLGDAFYKNAPLVSYIDDISKLKDAIPSSIKLCEKNIPETQIENFIQAIWDNSILGEIYSLHDENINNISNSLIKFIS